MTFFDAIKSGFSKSADFKGRATRSAYWWWFLFNCLAGSLAQLIHPSVYALFVLFVLLPSLSVAVRRLHDVDKSGWFFLIFLVPFIGLYGLYLFCKKGTDGPNRFGQDEAQSPQSGPSGLAD